MTDKTVLFVDDDPCVLQTLKLGLIGEPYKRLFARSAQEALTILDSNDVQVIVSDLKMPEMGGLELLKIVCEKWPSTVRMVLSGYAHVSTLLNAINQGHIYKFIMKPWKIEDEFKPAIREALDFYDTHLQNEPFSKLR